MYQVALECAQTQLAFLVEKATQGEDVIITDKNGFRFKLISLTKLSERLLAPEIATPDNLFERNAENIFKKTAGILAHQKIDPLEWQKNIRNEWERE